MFHFILFYVGGFREFSGRSPRVRPLVSKMRARKGIWQDGLAMGGSRDCELEVKRRRLSPKIWKGSVQTAFQKRQSPNPLTLLDPQVEESGCPVPVETDTD